MPGLAAPTFKKSPPPPALDAGPRPAYVVTMATVGVQQQRPYKGKEKDPAEDIILAFEIAGETVEYTFHNDGEEQTETLPRIVSNDYRFFGGETSGLTKVRKAIDPSGEKTEEGKRIDKLLGEFCQVTLNKVESKNDGHFRNYIQGVSGPPNLPGGTPWTPPERQQDLVLFVFDEPDWESFLKLPRWIQQKCKSALNYEGSPLHKLVEVNEQVASEESTLEEPQQNLPHEV